MTANKEEVLDLITDLARREIILHTENGALKFRAPKMLLQRMIAETSQNTEANWSGSLMFWQNRWNITKKIAMSPSLLPICSWHTCLAEAIFMITVRWDATATWN